MKKNRTYGLMDKIGLLKMITIMRFTIFILFLSLSQTFAVNSYSQQAKLSFDMRNARLEDVLDRIEKNSEFFFMYNKNMINVDRKVDIQVEEKNVNEVLNKIFANTDISYSIKDRQILLINNRMAGTGNESISQQPKSVSGKVTDSSGGSLPGVSVVVKGTTDGTITDSDGKYSISKIPENAVLQFSFVGMKTQEIAIGGKTAINVILAEDAIGIEEVVAVGYGVQKKVNLTGAVEQVTAKELATKSVANLGQALQGIVPNLNITFADGNPLKNPSFNIRGGTSFSGNNFQAGSPLILVDGVPMDFNDLNPDDIDNLSVIKDASASAIYGARAAYGVILITTKKGNKESSPRISFSTEYQIQKPSGIPDLLNSMEYQQAIINAQKLDGGTPSADDEYKLQQVTNYFNNPETAPKYYTIGSGVIWVANINPWKEFLKDSAPLKNHTLSISGGTAKSNYYASLAYKDQDGMVNLGEDWRKTYNATLGFSTDINDWLKIDTKALYTKVNAKRPNGQGGYSADSDNYFEFLSRIGWRVLMTPRYTPADSPVGIMPTHTPLNAFLNDGNITSETSTLMLRIGATAKISDWLSFKADYAYKSIDGDNKLFLPLVWRVEKSWVPFTEGFSTLSKSFSKSDYFVSNAYFDFHKTFKDKHEISAVAGFNQELYKYEDLSAQGLNLITEGVPVLKLTTGTKTFSDNESHWAIRGAFCRLNYIFNNKYLFEMNGRYDGTSKFPTESRFKFFPSFSAGWRVSEEKFMNKVKPTLSNLKLRASYGSLGNQDVNNYAYISTYGLTSQVAYIMNGTRPIGINPPGLVSANLTWETASTLDFGMDVTLFDKLTINYDWYNRKTRDILTSAEKLPSVLGATVPNQNSGKMKTTGWEFSAKWSDQLRNGLKYNISFVLSDYQSEILSFSGNPQKLISSLYDGKKMGEIWGYVTNGLFQTYEEIANAPTQKKINGGVWRPGDVRYENLNGDNEIGYGATTVNDPGDKKIIGNSTPRFQFGLNTDLTWRNFDFNMFWQGVGKRDYWTNSFRYWGLIDGTNINGGIGTKYEYYNSWTPERTDAFFPAFKPALKNMEVQSRYLINGAFARLKNVTIGYTLPDKLTERLKINRLRIYASGYNIATISKTPSGIDPEMMDDEYPLLHSYTIGLQLTF